jgi:hypothetical protein
MIEKNQIGENETRIENATVTLRKYEHTGRFSCKECGFPFDANTPDSVHKLLRCILAGNLTGLSGATSAADAAKAPSCFGTLKRISTTTMPL